MTTLDTLIDYAQLVEALADAVVVADPSGAIRFWNPAAERLFGFTEVEAVPTENSVRINPHSCGTLIADLVDALSLLASTSESKDWQSLPRPVVECIQVQGVRIAKESGFD